MTYKKHPEAVTKTLMLLHLNHPNMLKKVIISPSQISLLRATQQGPGYITTRALSLMDGITTQCASQRLISLWTAGYLTRRETVAESGGIEYLYKVSFELPEEV